MHVFIRLESPTIFGIVCEGARLLRIPRHHLLRHVILLQEWKRHGAAVLSVLTQ